MASTALWVASSPVEAAARSKLLLQLGEAFARERRKNRFAVAEVMVRSLVAHARLPRHLPHAEPVEPPLADQGNARFQHFLAEIGFFGHGGNSCSIHLTLSSRLLT